jgi:hypothetical protein
MAVAPTETSVPVHRFLQRAGEAARAFLADMNAHADEHVSFKWDGGEVVEGAPEGEQPGL